MFTLRKIDLHKPTAAWYSEYLQSERWRALRARLITERGTLCEVCHKQPHYSLHHNTYARLFNETDEDVTLVCKECHTEIHQNYSIPLIFFIYENDLHWVRSTLRYYKLDNTQPKLRS